MDLIAIDPDLELVARIRGGDPRAMDTLLRRYQPRLYRYCRRRLDNPEDAREVVQEALLAIARGIDGFRGGASLSSWVFAVARSFCLKKVRRSKFAPLRQDSLDLALERELLPAAGQRPPDVTLQTRELVDHLDRAIAELDPADREILLLRDHEGLRANEVAERLGLSVPAVKSRLHRARQAVRRRLAPLAGPELRPPPTIAAGAEARGPGPGGAIARAAQGGREYPDLRD
ncbi:MAG: sigma-70 family RNA polymerase sigma factor [Myxococcales bacterium]|nr:sigma-70 family RNA polymerase sigma factor [Myxococcales bacterium]